MAGLKLFMLLLGGKPPGRHTEQHDIFFGVGENLKSLIPEIHTFWPQAVGKLHIDAWREVTAVDGYRVTVADRKSTAEENVTKRLYFINLGGYKRGHFDEPHFKIITVQSSKAEAMKYAKSTMFFKEVHFPGAESHIDDKYGVDVDDLFEIEEVLPLTQKKKFRLKTVPDSTTIPDEIYLGYLKLSSLR